MFGLLYAPSALPSPPIETYVHVVAKTCWSLVHSINSPADGGSLRASSNLSLVSFESNKSVIDSS